MKQREHITKLRELSARAMALLNDVEYCNHIQDCDQIRKGWKESLETLRADIKAYLDEDIDDK